ncbi:MAG: hypothetical protein AB7H96_22905 [Vicinamibacterales bacterium]
MTLVTLQGVAGVTGAQERVLSADEHRQMMNDASDAQEDFRFAVADKDQKGAVDALVKLERFMGQTETYWAARKSADGVKLARESRASASAALSAARSGNLAGAAEPFDRMGASCNACHELHLEQK